MNDASPPAWPITIEEIASRWHCGVRWLKLHAKSVGLGRRAGRRILFGEDEYNSLYQSLPRPQNRQAGSPLLRHLQSTLSR